MPRGFYQRKLKPPIERFMNKIIVNEQTGCWEWTGYKLIQGYGHFRLNGKTIKAHRFAYEHFNNTKIPEGLVVCHTCDNPKCVNYKHLWLGTNQDNHIDCALKGRQHLQKLSKEDVLEIKKRLADGDRQIDIAFDFGVGRTTISQIKTNRSWNHLNNN